MPIKPAFSAVELLLVAGISAILVAIAVPGYMEAKARAETTDVSNSLRHVRDAISVYRMDCNQYPEPCALGAPNPLRRLAQSQIYQFEPTDRFKDNDLRRMGGYYADPYFWYGQKTAEGVEFDQALSMINRTASMSSSNNMGINTENRYWYVKSIGPDQTDWHDEGGERLSKKMNVQGMVQYDPSNGVFSLGEIFLKQSMK